MSNSLAIAVLAAGASRRFGCPKQLALIDGEPLVRRQCRVVLESSLGEVAVVLGCEAEACAAALAGLPVQICSNERWQTGLASSIHVAGVWAQARGAEGLLLLLGDQYRITAGDLTALAEAWSANREQACRASHEAYRGPPVILPSWLFPRLKDLEGDQGARHLFAALPEAELCEVAMPNAAIDLDTPDQLPP